MIKLRRIALIMAVLIVGIAIIGCTSDTAKEPNAPQEEEKPVTETTNEDQSTEKAFTIVDDFGREVTLQAAPERIISLAPSNTEIIYALGLGNKVVGLTTYDDYPAEVLEVDKIGDFNGINLEKIVELEPDLVISYGPGNEEENKRFDEAGIVYAGFEPESIDAVLETIRKIGKLTGRVEEANTLIEEMSTKKDEILSKLEGIERKTVFYEIWHDPLMAAGAGSFMNELITFAGGENIAKDADGGYPQFDLEQLVERNPQVYLTSMDLPEKTVESIKERPGYENIDAIINDRVYVLEPNIVSRPGPRIIEALEIVAKSIHPEKF